jgi:hypothetical protein
MSASKTFEDALGKLNSDYFFREFTFSSNEFKPTPSDELELADKIVWLDDLLMVYQVKERCVDGETTPDKERAWFESVVMDQGTSQIRDTISYLKAYSQIELKNDRGDVFDFATAQAAPHKIVIYFSHPLLPEECVLQKYHYSKTAAVIIHVLHAEQYFQILNTLVTPVEIWEYFAYREALATRFRQQIEKVSEKALLGHYLRNLPDEPPTAEFETLVDKLWEQNKDWDISHMIRVFKDRVNTPGSLPETEYKILKALARLYRTEMKEFKKRFFLSMEKAVADEPFLPCRFTNSNNHGFLFIPLTREKMPHRKNLLLSLTALNKYDLKLDKCLGLTFIADDKPGCDVQWHPLEFPWQENTNLEKALDSNYPFRPVKEARVERYGLHEPDQKQ